ncbi:hypothetical protein HYW53_01720 [Candidatus Giovannonibacteria bacterium]|nr:hypothetical protein [Candidatus Giovannonibacteria bacterium]
MNGLEKITAVRWNKEARRVEIIPVGDYSNEAMREFQKEAPSTQNYCVLIGNNSSGKPSIFLIPRFPAQGDLARREMCALVRWSQARFAAPVILDSEIQRFLAA